MGESSIGQREARSLFIMKTSILILGLSLVLSNVSAKNFGGINIEGAGMVYVVGPDWSAEFVSVNGNGVTLSRGGRIYFAKDPVDDFSNPDVYWQTPLLGNHFSFDVDLSRVGCHCNAAAYFIQMPGYNSGQSPEPGEGGDYYCDANKVGGNYCPEYDNFEGNKYTMASTLHTCNYVPPNFYDWCDGGGCQTNAFNAVPNMMCPEDHCTINTNKPFTVSHAHGTGGDGTMSYVNNWFSQEGRTADFNVCSDSNYVKNMGYSLGGIVFSASLWGGPGIDMSWLDGMTGCQGECNIQETSVTFKNFQLGPV